MIGRFTCLDPIAEEFYYVSPYNYAENSPIANIDLWGLQALNAQIYATIQANKAKYTAIAQQGGGSLMNLVVGSTRSDRIPSDVRASMSSGTQSMINFSGKVSDAANVTETAANLTNEVVSDVGASAEAVGNGMSDLGLVLAPVTEGASLVLVPIGEGIAAVGGVMQVGTNLADGNVEGAMSEVVDMAVGAATNSATGAAIKQSKKVGLIENATQETTQTTVYGGLGRLFEGVTNLFREQAKNDEEQ